MGQTQSMNQVLNKKKEEAGEDIDGYKTLLKLMDIEKSMQQKLDCMKSKMYIHALNDECLPILCAVDRFHDIIVVIKSNEIKESKVADELKKHLSGKYLKELTSLLTKVLKSMMTIEPEQEPIQREIQQTHVVVANKSVIRIDYYLQFDSTRDAGNILMYYLQVGVIDIARARLPVLIYELNRATDDKQMERAGKELKKRVNNTVNLFQAMQTLAKAARKSAEPEENGKDKDEEEEDEEDGEEEQGQEQEEQGQEQEEQG